MASLDEAIAGQEGLLRQLQEVIDRQQIHEVLMRYCRGVDRADEEMVNSTFHDDAIDDHGVPRPAKELAAGIGRGTQPQLMHFSGNHLIELDGDKAYVESYFISFSPQDVDGKTHTRTRAGRYVDRFEKRNGEWKIAYRRVIDEWSRLDELKAAPEEIGVHSGSRSKADPVYHLREVLR